MQSLPEVKARAPFAALVLALLAAACASDDGGERPGPPLPSVADGAVAVEAAAPAAEGPGFTRVALAFPTGDRSTSALLLEKEMPAEVIKGKGFDYLLVVQNLTDRQLDHVRVTETVPAVLEVESSEPAAEIAGDLASWDLGALAPRASKTVRVSAVPTGSGELETYATVEYESRLRALVTVVAPTLEVVIDAPAEGLLADPVPVTVSVTNTGSGDARGVRVVEELPEGLATASGQTRIVMDFGTLEAGQAKARTVELVASRAGAFTHTAAAEAGGGLTAAATPVTTVLRQPRLALELSGDGEVRGGRPFGARLVVANTGDGVSAGTRVSVGLPQGVRAVTFTEGAEEGEGSLVWDLGEVEPGASRTLEMTLRAADDGVLVTEAVVAGRGAEQQSATLRTEIAGQAALGLQVDDESDLIPVGETVTYVIVVENEGTADATQVVVSAEVEEGIEIVGTAGAVGAVVEGRAATFAAVPVLAPGETIELRVQARSSVELDSRFRVSVASAEKSRPITATESTDFFK